MKNNKKTKTSQLILGFILAYFGMVLLVVSFFVPPLGVIDASVLAAIGEVFTFSGALIGIDYRYKQKHFEQQQIEEEQTEEEQTEEEQTADKQ